MESLEIKRLFESAKNGNEYAWHELFDKYKTVIYARVKKFHHPAIDFDDFFQEALIAFYNAVMIFDDKYETSFEHFLGVVIENRLSKYIQSNNRQKRRVLNDYISFYQPYLKDTKSNTRVMLIEVLDISPKSQDPYVYLETKETLDFIKKILMRVLTKMELQVLDLYLKGYSYREIAEIIQKNTKSVDNTIQRIKRKTFNMKNEIKKAIAV